MRKVEDWDVYVAFRRAQGNANDRGFRLPKDFDAFLDKMAPMNREWLQRTTIYFNTTYQNIDLDRYMECGFDIWKSFTYKHMLHEKVIQLYISRDKARKRKLEVTRREIETTFNNISDVLVDRPERKGYGQLQNFCKFRDGEIRICINMYVQGKVDVMTLAYCVNRGYIQMTDDERALSPYLVKNYRELLNNLEDVKSFIIEKENELNEENGRQAVS